MMDKKQKLVPEIRFKGFTEDWEQRKFEDYYKMCSGYAFKYQNYVNNGVPIVNGESIQHGKVDSVKINYLPENFRKNYSDFLLYEGDIVVGLNRPITEGNLKIARIPSNLDKSLLYQRAGKIKFLAEIDADFSYILLQKQILKHTLREAVGSDQPFISTSKLDKWMMMIPKSREEKIKIGLLFKNLDNLITLHQRKLKLLKQLKLAYLQQMFPHNGEKVPQLRFANFSAEWEQRKLGEISNRVTRKNKDLESTLPLTISAQYGLVDQVTFFNKQVASKDTSGYFLLKHGEFAYNKSYSKDYPWGVVKRLNKHDMGVLSTLYIVFKPTEVDSDFLVSYYETEGWHKEVAIRAAEGARNHGLLNITATDFFDTELMIPTDNNEQVKIGQFFTVLEKTITLQQKKADSLKKIKSIYLKSMFI